MDASEKPGNKNQPPNLTKVRGDLPILSFLRDEWRVLTFRRPSEGIRTHQIAYLLLGLGLTWLVGIGRYWDHANARWWQYLGLGSVMYVILLAALIWLLIWPLGPKNWSYKTVLLFLTMTSAPGLLYAIPVEMFLEPAHARNANTWALALVAFWRVALYLHFLIRVGGLTGFITLVAATTPIFFILFFVSLLNIEVLIMSEMRGDQNRELGPDDGAHVFVFGLTGVSFYLAPFWVIAYAIKVLMVNPGRVNSSG